MIPQDATLVNYPDNISAAEKIFIRDFNDLH